MVQLGWDRDFGEKLGPFIRVISFASDEPMILSNTQLTESIQFEDRLAGFLPYRMVAGKFYDNGRQQLIVLNEDTLGVHVYRGK